MARRSHDLAPCRRPDEFEPASYIRETFVQPVGTTYLGSDLSSFGDPQGPREVLPPGSHLYARLGLSYR